MSLRVDARIAWSLVLFALPLRCGGKSEDDSRGAAGAVGGEAATPGDGGSQAGTVGAGGIGGSSGNAGSAGATGVAGVAGGVGNAGSAGTAGDPGRCRIVVGAAGSPDVRVDLTSRAPRALLWSVGYWTWPPDFGDPIAGTEELLAPLEPQLIRIGGYNPDANIPNPFDEGELDDAVAYAEAVGSALLLQLPLLARPDGGRPTPQDAADMIRYANVTMGYGIGYVSIGNEPDLYPDQGGLVDPRAAAIPGYTAQQFCAEARPMVEAVLGVDSAVKIVGPDLGYKYQPSIGPDFDWLTPILTECGDLFDVVGVHRYPFESLAATPDDARGDMAAYRVMLERVRSILSATGQGAKPLAITEADLAYVASPTGNPGGSILATPAHALWTADFFGVSAELDLWTASTYVVSGPDEFIPGLIGLTPNRPLRPAYHAISLAVTPAGALRHETTSTDDDLRAYASRHRNDTGLHLALVHWGESERMVAVRVQDTGNAAMDLQLSVPALSITSLEIPDAAAPIARTYGRAQIDALLPPVTAEVRCAP